MKQKKNKTNQVVTWPTVSLFSIKELHRLNPKFVEITLRVKLGKAIESGKVSEIGSIPGKKGRPQKVFTLTPVTQLTIDKARAEQISFVDGLVDNDGKLTHVMSVGNTPARMTFVPASPLGKSIGVNGYHPN